MAEQEIFSERQFKEIVINNSLKRMNRAGEALDRVLHTKPQDQTMLIASLRELYIGAAISVSVVSRDIFVPPSLGERQGN